MFRFLKKKVLAEYLLAAHSYLESTYEPEKFCERYSVDTGDIPDEGDSYNFSEVRSSLEARMEDDKGDRLSRRLDLYLDLTFVDMLTRYIREKGWRDSRVYKAAQLDRRLFSKMMSNRQYKPSRDTAIAFAIALQLTLTQANDLLGRAGYALSHSNKRDVIIEYFIREGIYDLRDINDILYRLEQKPIGR